jgi:LEA14-like dessication related protein
MRKYCLCFFISAFILACKSPPSPLLHPSLPPDEISRAILVFDHIEAGSIHQIDLYFRLNVENTRAVPLNLNIKNWKTSVNGIEVSHDIAVLVIESLHERLEPGAALEKNLTLRLNLGDTKTVLPELPDGKDSYMAELTLDMSYSYGTAKSFDGETSVTAVFPRIRAPEFTITSIAIMQAELINTRFMVNLRIDNPNPFPVTLSSFSYALYGGGLLWVNGREQDVMHITEKGSGETRLFLVMNFINMKRHLLDEIVAMRMVSYRFSGEAEVGLDIPWLPHFSVKFDHSGYSEVFK